MNLIFRGSWIRLERRFIEAGIKGWWEYPKPQIHHVFTAYGRGSMDWYITSKKRQFIFQGAEPGKTWLEQAVTRALAPKTAQEHIDQMANDCKNDVEILPGDPGWFEV